jgi:hypothetical protein
MDESEVLYLLNKPALKTLSGIEALNLLINSRINYLPEIGNWSIINKVSLNNLCHQNRIRIIITSEEYIKKGSIHQRVNWKSAVMYYEAEAIMFLFNPELFVETIVLPGYRYIINNNVMRDSVRYLFKFIEKEPVGDADFVEKEFIYLKAGAGVLEESQILPIKKYSIDLKEVIKKYKL